MGEKNGSVKAETMGRGDKGERKAFEGQMMRMTASEGGVENEIVRS